jgi:hypothetical protein
MVRDGHVKLFSASIKLVASDRNLEDHAIVEILLFENPVMILCFQTDLSESYTDSAHTKKLE